MPKLFYFQMTRFLSDRVADDLHLPFWPVFLVVLVALLPIEPANAQYCGNYSQVLGWSGSSSLSGSGNATDTSNNTMAMINESSSANLMLVNPNNFQSLCTSPGA